MIRAASLLVVALSAWNAASELADAEAAGVAEPAPVKKPVGRKPIVTADVVYGTTELLYEIYDTTYSALLAGPIAKHKPGVMLMVDEGIAAACSKMGKKKEEVYAKIDEAKAVYEQTKATLTVKFAAVHEKANEKVAELVAKFDKAVPKFAGAVPNTLLDLIVFKLYCLFVLYMAFSVFRFFLRLVLRIFCCFCCCGCCRSSKKAGSAAPKKAAAKPASKKNGKK